MFVNNIIPIMIAVGFGIFGGILFGVVFIFALLIFNMMKTYITYRRAIKNFENVVNSYLRGEISKPKVPYIQYSFPEIPIINKRGEYKQMDFDNWINEVYPLWPIGVWKTLVAITRGRKSSFYYSSIAKAIEKDRAALANALTHKDEEIRFIAEEIINKKRG